MLRSTCMRAPCRARPAPQGPPRRGALWRGRGGAGSAGPHRLGPRLTAPSLTRRCSGMLPGCRKQEAPGAERGPSDPRPFHEACGRGAAGILQRLVCRASASHPASGHRGLLLPPALSKWLPNHWVLWSHREPGKGRPPATPAQNVPTRACSSDDQTCVRNSLGQWGWK